MPDLPKLMGRRASFQKVRQLVDVVELQVSAKQVPQQVERVIGKSVRGMERGKRKRPDFAYTPPVPEPL
jgi:hypothetical protein